jgi:hypothetical protein
MDFKKQEIQEHFDDYIKDQDQDWINDNIDDLHHHAFNSDYYIIGTYQAKQWLDDEVFNIIDFIKEYEQMNFGEVFTDFASPEAIVNMYVYIIGEEIVWDYINQLEVA